MNSGKAISAGQAERLAVGHSRGLRGLAFGLVLLSFCVFGWGLRYKLSLYDPPHSLQHRMPQAKLLSGNEKAALVAVDLRRMASPDRSPLLTTFAVASLLVLAFRSWAGHWERRPAFDSSSGSPQSVPRLSFSSRPPPRRS